MFNYQRPKLTDSMTPFTPWRVLLAWVCLPCPYPHVVGLTWICKLHVIPMLLRFSGSFLLTIFFTNWQQMTQCTSWYVSLRTDILYLVTHVQLVFKAMLPYCHAAVGQIPRHHQVTVFDHCRDVLGWKKELFGTQTQYESIKQLDNN